MDLQRTLDRRQRKTGLGDHHADVGALATDKAGDVIVVLTRTNEDVQQVVGKDDHLLEIVMAIVFDASGFAEQLFDRSDSASLKQICGGRSDKIKHLTRMSINGLYTKQHARRHVYKASSDTFWNVADCFLNRVIKFHHDDVPLLNVKDDRHIDPLINTAPTRRHRDSKIYRTYNNIF